jgi:hypothetical protein
LITLTRAPQPITASDVGQFFLAKSLQGRPPANRVIVTAAAAGELPSSALNRLQIPCS